METNKCPHCGASMKAWIHTLTPGLVTILIKAIRFVKEAGVNEFHVHKDIGLTHFESANFQKLRFHGLVAHADPEARRNGKWLLTKKAGEFLRGESVIPRKVKTFRNRVLEHSEEVCGINDFRGQVNWLEQEFAFEIADGKVLPLKPKQYENKTMVSNSAYPVSVPVKRDSLPISGLAVTNTSQQRLL